MTTPKEQRRSRPPRAASPPIAADIRRPATPPLDFIGTLVSPGPPAELSNISVPESVDPHPRHVDLRGSDALGGTRHVTPERFDMTNPKSLFAHDFSSTLSQLQLTSDPASAAVSK